jgi:hypothetical protein
VEHSAGAETAKASAKTRIVLGRKMGSKVWIAKAKKRHAQSNHTSPTARVSLANERFVLNIFHICNEEPLLTYPLPI